MRLHTTRSNCLLRILKPSICLAIVTCIASTNLSLRSARGQSVAQASHAPAGWLLAGSKPANYDTGIDRSAMNNGQPSAFLRSTVASTGGFGTLMQSINAGDYAGKRVRLRAWVKSQNVVEWAGVWMRVDKDKTAVAFDNMQNRPSRAPNRGECAMSFLTHHKMRLEYRSGFCSPELAKRG